MSGFAAYSPPPPTHTITVANRQYSSSFFKKDTFPAESGGRGRDPPKKVTQSQSPPGKTGTKPPTPPSQLPAPHHPPSAAQNK